MSSAASTATTRAVGVGLGVGNGVGDADGVGNGVYVGDGSGVLELVTVAVGIITGEGDGSETGDGVGDRVGEAVGVAVDVAVGPTVFVGVGLGVAVRLAVAVGVRVGLGVRVAVLVAAGMPAPWLGGGTGGAAIVNCAWVLVIGAATPSISTDKAAVYVPDDAELWSGVHSARMNILAPSAMPLNTFAPPPISDTLLKVTSTSNRPVTPALSERSWLPGSKGMPVVMDCGPDMLSRTAVVVATSPRAKSRFPLKIMVSPTS